MSFPLDTGMKKLIFSLSLLLITVVAYPQFTTTVVWDHEELSASSDTVNYNPGSKLTWADFRGKPDQKSVAAAITSSGFGYTMSMKTVNGRGVLVINVNCYFQRNNSWVKRGMKTDYALLHEQHHFDITYIVTAGFIKKLRAAVFTRANYEALLEKLNKESYDELERMQNAYDGETRNGQLKNVQAEWNSKLDTLLSQTVIR